MDAAESKRDAAGGWNRAPRKWVVPFLFIVLLALVGFSWSASMYSLEQDARALRMSPAVRTLGPGAGMLIVGAVRNFKLAWAGPFLTFVVLSLWCLALFSCETKLRVSNGSPTSKVQPRSLWWASAVLWGIVWMVNMGLIVYRSHHALLASVPPAYDPQLRGLADFLDTASQGPVHTFALVVAVVMSWLSLNGTRKRLSRTR